MPLVTRKVNQGNLFKESVEPQNWQNGDIWSDTDDGIVYVNVSGTAKVIGRSLAEVVALS